jgi:NADH:ubiquinone oxidoreductase subunit 2 (subunit N)
MLISSILTIYQNTLKRFLAYSSLAHQGFLFLVVYNANYSFLFYLFVYSFSLLLLMIFFIYSYNLYLPSLLILSLIGLPPLPGFFAKLYILQDLILNNYYFVVFILIFISLILTTNYIYIILIGFKNSYIHPYISRNSNFLSILLSILLFYILI